MHEESGPVKANELFDPLTGECPLLNEMSADELIDLYERMEVTCNQLRDAIYLIRREAGARVAGTLKTQRLEGKSRKAKVTFPSDGWNDAILREAYHSFPQLRDEFLKIKSVGVIAKEFKKLEGTTIEDNPPLFTFREVLRSAVKPSSSPPTITVEK